jgi:integrase
MSVYRPTYPDPKTGEKKRSAVWWYHFVFDGKRYQESTKQTNKRVAEQMEAARKTQLAKGEVGIKDRTPAPTLKDFEARFTEAIETQCANKPETVSFYKEKYRRLLDHAPFAKARLDEIDRAMIDAYKQTRRRQLSRYGRPVSPGSVNRELATLSRALRLALDWDLIGKVPKMKRLPGERVRDFVLDQQNEDRYLAAAPQPLKDAALLMIDTGLRAGEAASLQWSDIWLQAAVNARHGYLHVRDGKSKNAKRTVQLTERVAKMLQERKDASKSVYLFPGDSPAAPILVTSLDHQHDRVREALKLPKDFVIHSLRHTMLTRLGESGAGAFGIMRIAGHSSVTVSQRYVHPSEESTGRAFERLEAMNAAMRERVAKDSAKVEVLEMPQDRCKAMK